MDTCKACSHAGAEHCTRSSKLSRSKKRPTGKKDGALQEVLHRGEAWIGIGSGKAVRQMRNGLVVEYNTEYRAAVGVVSTEFGVTP